MASTAAPVPRLPTRSAGEVSLMRLHVLRATYLLLVVGLGAMIVPVLLSHDPLARGVIVMPIVIPWGYVYRRYVRQQADRWR